MGLVFFISHFFIIKTAPANKWMRKKIPSCSNSALVSSKIIMLKKKTQNFLEKKKTRSLFPRPGHPMILESPGSLNIYKAGSENFKYVRIFKEFFKLVKAVQTCPKLARLV